MAGSLAEDVKSQFSKDSENLVLKRSKMFGKKKIDINAVMDSQLDQLLRKTSQYDELFEKKLLCESCKTVITLDNIGIMIPTPDSDPIRLKFYCEKISCMEDYRANG